MPEYTELVSSCMLARHWFDSVRGRDFDFQLDNIMIDATTKEQKAAIEAKEDSNVAKGLPYNIEPGCTVRRGQNGSQGPVYPPPLGQIPISAANIELVHIEFNPRNVILEMLCDEMDTGRLILQVYTSKILSSHYSRVTGSNAHSYRLANIYRHSMA